MVIDGVFVIILFFVLFWNWYYFLDKKLLEIVIFVLVSW